MQNYIKKRSPLPRWTAFFIFFALFCLNFSLLYQLSALLTSSWPYFGPRPFYIANYFFCIYTLNHKTLPFNPKHLKIPVLHRNPHRLKSLQHRRAIALQDSICLLLRRDLANKLQIIRLAKIRMLTVGTFNNIKFLIRHFHETVQCLNSTIINLIRKSIRVGQVIQHL